MNSNSPMMHRVTRQRHRNPIHVSIPKKGRIRVILVLIGIILAVRFGPAILRSVTLPEINFQCTPNHTARVHKKSKRQIAHARHLVQLSVQQLMQQPGNLAVQHPLALTGHDSVTVFTSIDTMLKKHHQKLFRRYHPLYGAIVALHPATGRILSLVTYTGDSMPDLGTSLCCKSFFPAASIFKTITAAAAIEHASFFPGCILQHRGRTSTLYRSQLKPHLDWFVDISFSQAYARSVNAAFGRIGMYDVGREQLLATATSFGFNTPVPGDLPCEASVATCSDSAFELAEFASGFNQSTLLSPLHGACIAAALSEDGVMPVPTLIDSIIPQHTGTAAYRSTPAEWRRAVSSGTATTMRQMMGSVTHYGTARKQFRVFRNSPRFDDFIFGGKTGSVDKDGIGRIDWFVGFAAHPDRVDERIAVGVVTAHGAYWTVHSSYLAAETMRYYLRRLQNAKKAARQQEMAAADSSTSERPTP